MAFLTVPILTRLLGMSQWGLLALFQAATAPLMLLDMGIGTATVKYVAEAIGRRDGASAVRIAHTTLLFNLAIGLIGALVLVSASEWLAAGLFAVPATEIGRAITGFRLAAIGWFVFVGTGAAVAVIAAHQRYDISSRLATVSVVLTTGAGLAAAAATRDVVFTLAAQTGVAVVMAAAHYRAASKLLPGLVSRPRWDASAFRRAFSFGGWQAVALLGSIVTGWSDRYILGAFFAPAIVGFYQVAHALYIQLYAAFGEIGEVLFPAVSHREGVGDLPGARRLSLLVAWALTTGFGICATVLATVGGDLLHLWISPEAARESTAVLRLLCAVGIGGMAAVAPFHYVLGIGRTRWHAASAVVLGVVVVAAGLVLIPRFGLQGVGYGLLVGVLVRWVFVALIWRVHFATDSGLLRFAAHVWMPPVTSFASIAVFTRLHDSMGRTPTWGFLLAEGTVAVVLATTVHLVVNELVPGGAMRRREVVSSFTPLLPAWLVARSRSARDG